MKVALVLIASLLPTGAVLAGDSACADCHLSNPDLPSYPHVQDWQASIHGHRQVGCEQCHGGDATTFRKFLAHRGMVRSADPAGPLHGTQLPATCGQCHTSVYAAFASSSHGRLIEGGDTNIPSCISCHGPVALQGLGPNGLQVTCSQCHGPEGEWPVAETRIGGEALTAYREAVRQLKRVRSRVKKVRDGALAHDLEAAVIDASFTLGEAIERGHALDLRGMLDESLQAQNDISRLQAAIPTR